MVAFTPLDCANEVPAMAKFAMARNAIAVFRFMTGFPFHEASTLIAFTWLSALC
jgi:hypothetical protein